MPTEAGSADEIFGDALERARAERGPFVREACGADASLLAEVESLLAAHDTAEGFLETPALGGVIEPPSADAPDPIVGQRIGAYTVVRRLGSGGMGTVYLGERADAAFQKQVAIKLIKRGMDTEDILRRFNAERGILARLEHPGIARLLDGGATDDGRPFIVMEYIDGTPIDRFCRERSLSINRRLELFGAVCTAVQHAHQNLVIHRDLKPGNILVQEGERGEQVKLLDFGIAKVMCPDEDGGAIEVTAEGMGLLTPRYASPEQARGEPVSTASDVYALGVILYELLTGLRPYEFTESSRSAIERVIIESTPTRPSRRVIEDDAPGGAGADRSVLERQLRGDLDWITMKAMAKARDERYAAAAAVRADLERFGRHEPVTAGPPGAGYRVRKFARRHRLAVTGAAVLALTLVGGTVGTSFGLVRASRASAQAREEADVALTINRYLRNLLASPNPWTGRPLSDVPREVRVVDVLDDAAGRIETDFAGRPRLAAEVHAVVGTTYRRLGELDKAERHVTRALALRRDALGHEHEMTLRSRSELATVYWDQGRAREARREHKQVLEARTRVLGADHLHTLESMNDLANALWGLGQFDEAEALLVTALASLRRVAGSEVEPTLNAMSNLANQYVARERYGEAELLYEEELAIRRRLGGDEYPGTLITVINIATMYWHQGRYEEAERRFEETLTIQRRVLGSDHPATIDVMTNLGAVYESRGQFEEAGTVYSEAIERLRRTRPPGDRDVLRTLSNTASLYRKMERYEEAAALYGESVERHREALGSEFFGTGITLAGYGSSLMHLERFDEAEAALLEAHAILAASFGPEHGRTRTVVESLVELYERWGRPESADAWRGGEIIPAS